MQENNFAENLLKKTSPSIVIITLTTIFYIFFMPFTNHQNSNLRYVIIILAIIKTFFLSYTTIKQLSKLVKNCYSFNRLLWIFGLLIGLSIFSYATDYTCLFELNNASFNGINSGSTYFLNLFDFFYFSLTTFSTLGYGDIAPLSRLARLIVILETSLSFLIIVFALSNVSKIHLNEK